jgi:glutaredoxin
VFVLDDCPHCIRTKQALTDRDLPFVQISLTKHPKRRIDMLRLSNRLTVPQVFINSRHIGGVEETLTILKGWDTNPLEISPRAMYDRLIATSPDPSDPILQPSTTPAEETILPASTTIVVVGRGGDGSHPPPRKRLLYSIKLPHHDDRSTISNNNNSKSGKSSRDCSARPAAAWITHVEMTELLKKVVWRRSIGRNLMVYKNAFRGSDFVDGLVQGFHLTRMEAVTFASTLQSEHQVLNHVLRQHDFVDCDNRFYRLQCDQTPHILNSYRIWTDRADPNSIELLRRLQGRFNSILRACTDPANSGRINYRAVTSHEDYPRFEEAVCEIQCVDLDTMKYTMKLAYYINLYNLMMRYAYVKVGIADTDVSRNTFFTKVGFVVGRSNGRRYAMSFHDLESGILRSNRIAPSAISRQFELHDRRLQLVLPKTDNRIHFALSYGGTSCPPLKEYTADGILEELRIVALDFCMDPNNVRIEKDTLYLSRIFGWYAEDFGGNSTSIVRTVLDFLRGRKASELIEAVLQHDKLRIKYNQYDWEAADASDYVTFSSASIKADSRRWGMPERKVK